MRIPDPKTHENADGTYNGVTYFAELTGLPQAEIRWMFARAQELAALGFSKDLIKTMLREEGKSKPWETRL